MIKFTDKIPSGLLTSQQVYRIKGNPSPGVIIFYNDSAIRLLSTGFVDIYHKREIVMGLLEPCDIEVKVL